MFDSYGWGGGLQIGDFSVQVGFPGGLGTYGGYQTPPYSTYPGTYGGIPVTYIPPSQGGNQILTLALVIGVAWLLFGRR